MTIAERLGEMRMRLDPSKADLADPLGRLQAFVEMREEVPKCHLVGSRETAAEGSSSDQAGGDPNDRGRLPHCPGEAA